MEAFHKNIEGIRKAMSEMREEKYAIVNQDTAALDEYNKTLYLKMLCSLVQFHNEPTEMQLLFLKRIVNGIGVEEKAEEYMRRALEISGEDMQEFLSFMGKDKVKYYFALEGILLVSLGQGDEESYQYLAEVIELLDICKDDLTFVCLVGSAVLQQQSSFYEEAKKWRNARVEAVDYALYLKDFYYGAILENNKIVHYGAPDRKYSDKITFRTSYTEQKVILEGLDISVKNEWLFQYCEEVVLYDCDFSGDAYSISFRDCQKVHIIKCRFHDFRNRVIQQERNIEVIIDECEFENCIYREYSSIIGKEIGGVIYTSSRSENATNRISKTSFRFCSAINPAGHFTFSAMISNCRCVVTNCKFYNCQQYVENRTSLEIYLNSQTLFLEKTEDSENDLVNSARFS